MSMGIELPMFYPADIMYAFRESGFLSGKLIIFILMAASIYAWSVMVTKYFELRRAEAESRRFVASFRREKQPLALFLKRAVFPESPVYRVYESACLAIGIEVEARASGETADSLFRREYDTPIRLNMMQVNAVRAAAERQIADQSLLLEDKMGFLATAVSASPMMGLLGTVWGVLDSFSQMAVQGVATLKAVAPGIASALLTTVVGLLVAIPSAIGYNYLASRIRGLSVQLDNFADEFAAEIQRAYIKE